jgi:DNA-binding LytR/AlgR family response regulator
MKTIDLRKQNGIELFFKKKGGKIEIPIKISTILSLESDRNYTTIYFYFREGEENTLVCERKTLGDFGKELTEYGFLRISRSIIINERYIHSIEQTSKGKIMYLKKNKNKDKIKLKISKEYAKF